MHALLHQAEALEDAEAVLLVDDGEAEPLELDVLFEQRVGAHHDVGESFGDQFFELRFFAAGEGSGEQHGDVAEAARGSGGSRSRAAMARISVGASTATW